MPPCEYVQLATLGQLTTAILESRLRDAGIDFYLLDEIMNSVYGGGIRVMVRTDQVEAAHQFLK